MPLSVAVISHDTLHCLGIKALLQEFYGIIPQIIERFDSDNCDIFDIYIVDDSIFTSNLDYFIPRRQISIIISSSSECKDNKIGTFTPVNDIIDAVGEMVRSIEEKKPLAQNDLSQREIDVLKLIAEGYMNKEIADRLNISINTVLSHRKNITSKLGIRSVSGLSFYAMMHGYVTSI